MNRSAAVMFEENEKKKRKLFEDAPNYDANFLSNYVNEFNINHVGFSGVGGNEIRSNEIRSNEIRSNEIRSNEIRSNEIRSNDICVGQVGANQQCGGTICANHLGATHLGVNQNSFDPQAESRKDHLSPNVSNNCNSVHFNKNVLINSIDVLLNFINYSCLNESIKHEVLYDNLLNLRFHILSLNDEKFNQKKITEYFFKM
ncbi:hypothetical protein PCYB_121680 [Plasmodium cynomolgi strain B]|uniref:Uncharacterized protein n=1 Tax=Plasmodium cynomolgi (strain B) TaxID=1120755 RepID=K6UYF6_PLACD|nr:hypothetical protein PCYB_121680 [Plasmodium cynomolgi strain B]GAB67600.1 hypothetical protein PCYB_121680 [Plasmodium cynomolgi strain B]